MHSLFRVIAAAICALVFLQPGPAEAERRVALVIGNAGYTHAPALRNPTNDARAIADLLKQAGFDEVALKLDVGFEGMRLALRDFGLSTHDADVAVVYFAGHGLELGGENLLVPVDATLKSASSAAFEAATLSAVLDAIRPASRLRLVILDACRVNPFAARIAVAEGLTRSVPRGLGRIEPTGDVLVAYAAKAGTVAEDGKGRHSPYAEALLATLATPGLDIRLVMGRVRDHVRAKTGGAQEPFVYGSLGGANVALVSPGPGSSVNARADSADATAARDYELATKVGTKEAWDAFLTSHPTGFHAELARIWRTKLAASSTPSSATPEIDKALKGSYERPTPGALAERDYGATHLNAERALELVNAYRRENGLPPLKLHPILSKAARTHSRDLAKRDRISHIGSDGSNPWDRVKRAGYNVKMAAEVVGTGQVTIDEVMKGWRASPDHSKNLLLTNAEDMGIALVQDTTTEFKTFWTLVVASPQ